MSDLEPPGQAAAARTVAAAGLVARIVAIVEEVSAARVGQHRARRGEITLGHFAAGRWHATEPTAATDQTGEDDQQGQDDDETGDTGDGPQQAAPGLPSRPGSTPHSTPPTRRCGAVAGSLAAE